MHKSNSSFAIAITTVLLVGPTLHAQSPNGDNSPFRPLDLRPPNSYRTASGRPGAEYWQQRVDYQIQATLDAETNLLQGSETIHYVNNSPDDLPYLWMHLDQNICSPTGITEKLDQPPMIFLGSVFDFSCQGFAGGITIESVELNEKPLDYTEFGTTMRIDLPQPLAAGETIDFDISWHFTVPPNGAARMGRDGKLFQIAQWYPSMAVYDDLRGWNNEPYIGAGEFYMEYGRFQVALTLPSEFLVTATGNLQNPEDVLTETQRERLLQAASSEEPVAIVTLEEAGNAAATRPTGPDNLTWLFKADNVRDFAFAAGPNFRWDAATWNGILIQTFYRPSATNWEEAILMSIQSIRHFSEKWYQYPYPHATTVEGPVEGMEYPMLTFVPDANREDLQWVVSHEFGHEWFPMIVGSNERFYPWMDEGFNTFMDRIGTAEYFAGTVYGDTIENHALNLYEANAIPDQEQPLITRPAEVENLFWTAYQKPALMLQLLRNRVLGKDRFDSAFRAYIDAWAYKHPDPADFFRIMSDHSGMDLDWFWRGWVYTTARLDQSIESVEPHADGGTQIVLVNALDMVMPVELLVTYSDGRTEEIDLPVEMWNQGPRFTYRVAHTNEISSVEIDPDQALPDVDRGNNNWER